MGRRREAHRDEATRDEAARDEALDWTGDDDRRFYDTRGGDREMWGDETTKHGAVHGRLGRAILQDTRRCEAVAGRRGPTILHEAVTGRLWQTRR